MAGIIEIVGDAENVLTFGIELEFVCLWQDEIPRRSKQQVEEFNPRQSLQDALVKTKQIPVNPLGTVPATNYNRWTVYEDPTIDLDTIENAVFPEETCKLAGIELISRALRYREDPWAWEINTALKAVNGLDRPSDGQRVLANLTCGFHVHVGRGEVGFNLEEMKRVLMLMTAFERHLDQLHGQSRVERASYNEPLSVFFTRFFAYGEAALPRTMQAWLGRITHFELDNFPGKRYACNFSNCYYETANKRTIEFRQHRGTLIPEEIRAWISVVCQLVRYAVRHQTADIFNFCLARTSDPDFTVKRLLATFDVPEETMAFYTARFKGELDWLAKHDALCRLSARSLEVNEFAYWVREITTTDVRIGVVNSMIATKLMGHGYGTINAGLMGRIREKLMSAPETDEQGVPMNDAEY